MGGSNNPARLFEFVTLIIGVGLAILFVVFIVFVVFVVFDPVGPLVAVGDETPLQTCLVWSYC